MVNDDEQQSMDCLVVGGIADGALLREMRLDAEIIELSRMTHLKPLQSSRQDQPEAGKETQEYMVYTQDIPGPDGRLIRLGIAAPLDLSLWEAFAQIVVRYVQQATADQLEGKGKLQH